MGVTVGGADGLVEKGQLPKPLTTLLNLGRKYSIWVYQWGLACCAIEMGAAFGSPRYDVMRLGVIPLPASPRQADLVVISGTVTDKMAPAIAPPLRADARPEVRDLDGLAAPTAAARTGTATRSPRASTRSSRSTSTCPAARPGPRRCSRASCCCRSASRTRTWPSAGRVSRLSSTDGASDRRRPPTTPTSPRTTVAVDDALAEALLDERRATALGDAVVGIHIRSPATTSGSGSAPTSWRGRGRAPARRSASTTSASCRPSTGCRRRSAQGEDDPTEPPPERRRRPIRARLRRRRHPLPGLRPAVQHRPRHVGLTLKADVPDDADGDRRSLGRASTPAPTGTSARRGRCSASASPATRPAPPLPAAEFEGYPLRKDFPLLARMVKPWPGIVDVEPMPGRRRRGRRGRRRGRGVRPR